jgi:hypothetical protein
MTPTSRREVRYRASGLVHWRDPNPPDNKYEFRIIGAMQTRYARREIFSPWPKADREAFVSGPEISKTPRQAIAWTARGKLARLIF